MRCLICGKDEEETEIFEGIYEGEIVDICVDCAELEEVPLIKKPSEEKFNRAMEPKSVKERLEGIKEDKTRTLSRDQEVANKFLSKIKFPSKRSNPENLVENYYWIIQRARRKKGISLKQIANEIGISEEVLKNVEYGILDKNFELVINQLENILDIKILKRTPEESMRKKVENLIQERKEQNKEEDEEDKKNKIKDIASGKFDFSKRDKINNITLSDLVDLKKKKDKDLLMGDDIEIEE